MPGSADGLALFSSGNGFISEEACSYSQSHPSDSDSDFCIPFETLDFPRPLPKTAVRLQDPYRRCDRDRDLRWNIDWAVAFLVDWLEQNWATAGKSLRDIRIRAALLQEKGLSDEIPFRLFNKLDEVLFARHLKSTVFLQVDNFNSDVSGATYTYRMGPNPEVKRISIVLNHDAIEHGQARDILAILIHHMIHAYFLVACGEQAEREVDYGRLDHGVHFGKIMLTIKRLSAVHRRELTPLDYGHSSPGTRYLADEYYSSWRREEIELEDKEKWYCSHCHCYVRGPSDSDVDKWYRKVCQPMFDQPHCVRGPEVHIYNDRRHELEVRRRARLVSSAKSVEFMFRERPVLVEGNRIENCLSVMRAFDRAGSRFLKVPKEISEDTFMRFLEFIHTGSYRSDPLPFAAAAGLDIERRGPPIIKPQTTTTAAIVLADVQFAKFSILMDFEECKTYALNRMNAYGILYEDPVAVLKEIYRGYEPDSELKAWARKFLTRAPATSSQPDYHQSNPSSVSSTVEPPNLLKLESEHCFYRARFFDAIEASGALENDVNKARAELKAVGWYDWSPSWAYYSPSFAADHLPTFGLSSRSPFLLGGSSSSDSRHGIQDLTSQMSLLQAERLHDVQHERERMERELELKMAKRGHRERGRITRLQSDVDGELQRAREKVTRLEREKETRVKAAVIAEALLETGLGGRGVMHEY